MPVVQDQTHPSRAKYDAGWLVGWGLTVLSTQANYDAVDQIDGSSPLAERPSWP